MLNVLESRESELKNIEIISIAPRYIFWCSSDILRNRMTSMWKRGFCFRFKALDGVVLFWRVSVFEPPRTSGPEICSEIGSNGASFWTYTNATIIHSSRCFRFQDVQSSSFTPSPPKMSNALPIVRSTRPRLIALIVSRSSIFLPPPAYVTGKVHQRPKLFTKSSSMPRCRPSLSAAWIRNSEQKGSRILNESDEQRYEWRKR